MSTVKADAARMAFSAYGQEIVWAVLDSGIDRDHPHFREHKNLDLSPPLSHIDFAGNEDRALVDTFGHGTHVAGIIAGELKPSVDKDNGEQRQIRASARYRDESGDVIYDPLILDAISGVAPKCKLVSLKVLDDKGDGVASNLIAAIEW
ncbi:MAG TPA: S8 family serine peptidase, partial [Chloroflexota bacterium]|nr:S8 family serine peptidase [Chloroflexota bacterium]